MRQIQHLTLINHISELQRLAEAVEHSGLQEDWNVKTVFGINLALEEITVNIMQYGYQDQEGIIDVRISCSNNSIYINVSDKAPAFNPLKDAPEPVFTDTAEMRSIGGLGIHFVKNVMDEVRYQRRQDTNCLDMMLIAQSSQAI